VERKRLAGLATGARSGSPLDGGLYAAEMTDATYAALRAAAALALDAGYSALLDATFLQHAQREAARALATARGLPCLILDCPGDPAELRQRLRERLARGGDASEADEAVLAHQLATQEPLDDEERRRACAPGRVTRDAEGAWQADWPDLPWPRPQP
jgi:uncharacterized protein